MLQLGMDLLFVIWSTTIGKIVSGQVFLLFLLESLYLQRKGGHPLGPPFFFSSFFLFSPFLFFSLLLLFSFSLLFAVAWNLLFFRQSFLCIAGGTCAQSKLLDRELVGCDCRINERVFLRSLYIHPGLSMVEPNMFSLCEASTLQRTELNYVLPSSRLPQYYRLASLGHDNNRNMDESRAARGRHLRCAQLKSDSVRYSLFALSFDLASLRSAYNISIFTC